MVVRKILSNLFFSVSYLYIDFLFLNFSFFAFNRLSFFSGENKIIIIYFTGLHSFSIIMGSGNVINIINYSLFKYLIFNIILNKKQW